MLARVHRVLPQTTLIVTLHSHITGRLPWHADTHAWARVGPNPSWKGTS